MRSATKRRELWAARIEEYLSTDERLRDFCRRHQRKSRRDQHRGQERLQPRPVHRCRQGAERAMLSDIPVNRVYLACGDTDMRKSIDRLLLIIKEGFDLDPFSPTMFVFCDRQRDKLKIFYWEDNGFWLYYRHLEQCQAHKEVTARTFI